MEKGALQVFQVFWLKRVGSASGWRRRNAVRITPGDAIPYSVDFVEVAAWCRRASAAAYEHAQSQTSIRWHQEMAEHSVS